MMRVSLACPELVAEDDDRDERLRSIVTSQYAFVWRCLRHLGVDAADSDDAAQQVFIVVAKKLADVEPGHERAFAFATALRIASRVRRTKARRREADDSEALLSQLAAPADERAPARELLEQVLEAMPEDTRAVFMLFEVEELTMGEIAEALEIPPGTVASRLRRAREHFRAEVKRIEARARHRGV